MWSSMCVFLKGGGSGMSASLGKQDSQWNCETCDGTGYIAAWPYIQQIAGNFGGRESPHVL